MAGILLNRSRQVPAEETPAFGGIAERFRRGGDLDRAIALCRDGLKRFPDQLSARVTLGWSLLDKGQYDLARTELEQVLRKAPDNLAAIRGLAELHDRTEGTIATEDERAWRSNDAAAAAESAAVAAQPSPGADRAPATEVGLGNGGAEILHTAAYAEQIADAAMPDFGMASIEAVEVEAPAAASMAAAEPAPFFVVAPIETAFDPGSSAETTAPVPFDALTVEAVVEPVEIETPGAAALSAFVAKGGLDPEIQTESPNALFDDAELSELTAQVLQAGEPAMVDRMNSEIQTAVLDSTSPWQADVHEDLSAQQTLSDLGGGELPGDGEEVALAALLGVETGVDAILDASFAGGPETQFQAPEGLDDIDEVGGQELADAIKALEDATRRVEARLAPRPLGTEPATAPADIASYDFGPDPDLTTESSQDGLTLLDIQQEGSFELVAPDLSDLSFTLDTTHAPDEVDEHAAEPVEADASSPAFDFEAPASDDDAAGEGTGAIHVGEVDEVVEQAADEPAAQLVAPADIIAIDVVAAASEAVADLVDATETVEEAIEASASPTSDEPVVIEADLSTLESTLEQATAATAEAVGVSDDADTTAAAGATDEVAGIVESARDAADISADSIGVAGDAGSEASADAVAEQGDAEEPLSVAAFEDTARAEATVLVSESAAEGHAPVQPAVSPAPDPQPRAVEPSRAPAIDPTPVVHVYDAPVFVASAASAVVAEVAGLVAMDEPVALPTMGRVQTPVRSQLAALERFLRKVQARQLELRGETVA
jgi:hypothetical protein